MSRASDIREWLEKQGRPCGPWEIAAGLGAVTKKDRLKVYWAVGRMLHDKMLTRTGGGKAYFYSIARAPQQSGLPRVNPDERKARKNARDRERYWAKREQDPSAPKPKVKPTVSPPVSLPQAHLTQPPAESVEAFLARGGRVQRLPGPWGNE